MPVLKVTATVTNYLDTKESARAPTNPVEGQKWRDESQTPPVLKIYKEGSWLTYEMSLKDVDPSVWDDLQTELDEMVENIDGSIQQLENEVEQAKNTSNDAVAKANQAVIDANFSKDQVETATTLATNANQSAQDAVSQSSQAHQLAVQSATDASNALDTATGLLGRMDSAEGVITDVQTSIDDITGELEHKVSQTDFNTLEGTVDNHTGLISANSQQIALKASQSSVDTLSGRVNTAEGQISVQAWQIAQRLTASEVNSLVDGKGYATTASVNSQVSRIDGDINSWSSQLQTVQSDLDGLVVGQRNLLRGSSSEWQDYDFAGWEVGQQNYSIEELGLKSGDSVYISGEYQAMTGLGVRISIRFEGQQVVTHSGNSVSVGSTGVSSGVFTVPDGITNIRLRHMSKGDGTTRSTGKYRLTGVYKSTVPVDWTPAPEDLATVTALTTSVNQINQSITDTNNSIQLLTQTVTQNGEDISSVSSDLTVADGKITALNTKTDGHTTQIGNLTTSYNTLNSTLADVQTDLDGKVSTTAFSSLEQLVSGIQTTVADKEDKTVVTALASQWQTTTDLANGHTTQISSLGTDINLRVLKSDVINQINVSTEGILIAGNKVRITGQTSIDNGVIKTAMIGDLEVTGAKIADATIASAKIINLDASKISANTLSAITTNTGNLNISGNLTMTTDNTQIIGSYAYTEGVGDAYRPRRFDGSMRIGRRFTAFTGDVWWAEAGNTSKVGYAESFYGLDYYKQRIYNDNSADKTLQSRIDMYGGVIELSQYWGMGQATSSVITNKRIETPWVLAKETLSTNRINMANPGWNTFQINEYQTNGIPRLMLSNGDGGFMIENPSNNKASMYVGSDSSPRVWFPRGVYDRTYSAAANMHVTDAGTIGRSTSARKYKTEIQIANEVVNDAKKALQINPVSWLDKAELKRKGHSDRYFGFIADDFHDVGLTEVVLYGDRGQVESLAYDRISMYHNVILADHEKQLRDIKNENMRMIGEISMLRSEVESLRQLVA